MWFFQKWVGGRWGLGRGIDIFGFAIGHRERERERERGEEGRWFVRVMFVVKNAVYVIYADKC